MNDVELAPGHRGGDRGAHFARRVVQDRQRPASQYPHDSIHRAERGRSRNANDLAAERQIRNRQGLRFPIGEVKVCHLSRTVERPQEMVFAQLGAVAGRQRLSGQEEEDSHKGREIASSKHKAERILYRERSGE
jgi:hypothetical protein